MIMHCDKPNKIGETITCPVLTDLDRKIHLNVRLKIMRQSNKEEYIEYVKQLNPDYEFDSRRHLGKFFYEISLDKLYE